MDFGSCLEIEYSNNLLLFFDIWNIICFSSIPNDIFWDLWRIENITSLISLPFPNITIFIDETKVGNIMKPHTTDFHWRKNGFGTDYVRKILIWCRRTWKEFSILQLGWKLIETNFNGHHRNPKSSLSKLSWKLSIFCSNYLRNKQTYSNSARNLLCLSYLVSFGVSVYFWSKAQQKIILNQFVTISK